MPSARPCRASIRTSPSCTTPAAPACAASRTSRAGTTTRPCRYNTTGCYSAALAQQKVRTTPTNDAECEAVPGINTDEPIVYDSSCPGLCCFEDQPCRYNTTGCYSAALAQQKVRTTPTNDAECEAVPGINTDQPIVYDSSCPGLCCFEDQPCRYNTTGCYSAALAQQKVRTTPTNDAECEAVPGINTDEPIVYDSSCPGCAASRTSRAGTTPRAATPQPWRSRR
ncbi:unnamed protein product [Prorocentrum cordatum]|uniref:Uncharacterized protein n=1 Tax=Prorocentrum cordatum TaxID=2364126 RepID=A0ABN9TH18_9DINO|nr:unnamed protein product [Polarella glacialis]